LAPSYIKAVIQSKVLKVVGLLLFFFLLAQNVGAQGYYGSGNYNRIGVGGKYIQTFITTSELEMGAAQGGFLGGLTTRGRLSNDLGMVYGIDFLSTSALVKGRALGTTEFEDVKYTLIGAQLNLLLSYNILGNQHLAIDFGPTLLINGELKVDEQGQEDYILQGYQSLKATDISDISRVNALGTVALTGGFESVRFTLQYQFAITNLFNKLNKNDLEQVETTGLPTFKAQTSIVGFGVVFYL